jgi:hypothetical protein
MGFKPALDLSRYQPGRRRGDLQGPQSFDKPEIGGYGPTQASTCVALATRTIHDVNGYYRALGFTPPYRGITRRSLRLAYHRLGGENDVYLTQVFKLLLDAEQRREYDAAQPGKKHLDLLQIHMLDELVKREASRRHPEFDTRATQREILEEMGLPIPDEDSPSGQYPDGEDKTPEIVHTEDLPDDHPWLWGYYLLGTGRSDVDRLARWQELLVSALAALEVETLVAVGFIGRGRTDSRFVVGEAYGVRTVFLREDLEPDQEMAVAAAGSILMDLS